MLLTYPIESGIKIKSINWNYLKIGFYMFFLQKAPAIGFKMQYNNTNHTLQSSEPYTRKDGNQSVILNWQTKCQICGLEFEQVSGLSGKFLNSKCKEHRKPKSGAVGIGTPRKGFIVIDKVFQINKNNFKICYEQVGLLAEWVRIKIFCIDEKSIGMGANFQLVWHFENKIFSRSEKTEAFENLKNKEIVEFLSSDDFRKIAQSKQYKSSFYVKALKQKSK